MGSRLKEITKNNGEISQDSFSKEHFNIILKNLNEF